MSENIQFEDRINEVVKELDEAQAPQNSNETNITTTTPQDSKEVLQELSFGNENFDINTNALTDIAEPNSIVEQTPIIEQTKETVIQQTGSVSKTVDAAKESLLGTIDEVKSVVTEKTIDGHDVIAHHEGPFRDPYFWVLMSFIIFVIVAFKFGKKPILNMLDKRTEDIKAELEEAERLKVEAQDLLASYQRKYEDAMQTVDDILKQSKEANKQLKAQSKKELNEVVKRREEQLLERIKRAEQSAIQEVKEKAAEIASTATNTLILDYLNDNSDKLIDDQIKSLPKKI